MRQADRAAAPLRSVAVLAAVGDMLATRAVLVLGEIGGRAEEDLADYITGQTLYVDGGYAISK